MEYDVTVQIGGADVPAGRLFQNVRHGSETATFSYAESYLGNPRAFSLAPDMPLGPGLFHSDGLKNFRAFEDCMPDRWGRNLMLRAERTQAKEACRTARTLFELDFLIGVSDEARQGALRIWAKNGTALAAGSDGVPREVSIPSLLNAADSISTDSSTDIKDLIAAGSSLGGARPKASIRDNQGELCIAKFPKADEDLVDDTSAWEHVCLLLMKACGITTPPSRIIRIHGRSVLIVQRFDRCGAKRIPYISGLTAIQGQDGNRYCYLELAQFIEEEGGNPKKDLRELWLRALFSCAIGNTDNHMRNYGFLRAENGWVLSPVFDVNPTPGNESKFLNTGLDFDAHDADPRLALDVCDYFRMSLPEAKEAAATMAHALRGWRSLARVNGISEASIAHMESCFESGIARLESIAK